MDREPNLGLEIVLNGSHSSLVNLLPVLATLTSELKATFVVNVITSNEIIAMSAGLSCYKKITHKSGYEDCQSLDEKS